MEEFIFYIIAIVALGSWLFYKVKTDKNLYIDWMEDEQ